MAEPQQNPSEEAGGPGGAEESPQREQGINAIMIHLKANKVDAALWATRVFTIVSTIFFVFPLFGHTVTHYQRALLSNAITSALRLHQRLSTQPIQLSRAFFSRMFMEDSCHYLFYSLIFLMGWPVTMALCPVFLFALLHATTYSTALLDCLGHNSIPFARDLLQKLKHRQVSIIRFIACTEIFLMPVIVVMIFMGRSTLLLPFFYYRFLSMRYVSVRNPYCRQLFYELRITTEALVQRPQCPQFVANLCRKTIAFISRLAPQVEQQQHTQ